MILWLGTAQAESLLVWTEKASNPIAFEFDSQPKLTFGINTLKVESLVMTITYEIDCRIYFKFQESADITLVCEDQIPKISINKGCLEINNLSKKHTIKISRADGKIINQTKNVESFSTKLPNGIYLLTIGTETYKIAIQ